MESNKLEISGKQAVDQPPASYKKISESDTEETPALKKMDKPDLDTEAETGESPLLPSSEEKDAASKVDLADVKFTNNDKQNGDAKIDIGDLKMTFVGMGKEELLKYANDPFWVRLRWILFIAFWLVWIAMLVGAILIIVAAPKCAPPAPRTWWEVGPLSEVEVDTNTEKLTLLKDTVKGVIVPGPEDSYTSLNDSEEHVSLLERAKAAGVKVIVELKPVTSSQWLQKSEEREEPYADYYIWAKPEFDSDGNQTAPNNWLSSEGTSAWKYSFTRKEYYYAPGTGPHLNLRNQLVVEHFSSILREWLNSGVAGVRLRGVPHMLVDKDLKNESISSVPGYVHTDYNFYNHERTYNVEGTSNILAQWRTIVKNKTENGPFMLAEDLIRLEPYKLNNTLMIDLPRQSSVFTQTTQPLTATVLHHGLKNALNILGNDTWPIWEYTNTSLPSEILDMVTFLLRGSVLVSPDETVNKLLLDARSSPSIMYGNYKSYLLANDTVFAYTRVAAGNPGYLVAVNPSTNRVIVNFKTIEHISDEVTVYHISQNYSEPDVTPKLKIQSNSVPLFPRSALIVTYVPKTE